jgi:hypothetical protein
LQQQSRAAAGWSGQVTGGSKAERPVAETCFESTPTPHINNHTGGRSARLVNPVAWDKGAVFCQCQHCDVWHMLRADKSIVEEIR